MKLKQGVIESVFNCLAINMLSLTVLIVLFSASFAREISSSSSAEFSSPYVLNLNMDEFYDLLEKNPEEIIFTRFYLPS